MLYNSNKIFILIFFLILFTQGICYRWIYIEVKDIMSEPEQDYDKALAILDSLQPDINQPDLSNYLYILGYYGKQEYLKAYDHYKKIVEKNRYIPTEVYLPEIMMKIGMINLDSAKSQIDSVSIKYDSYEILILTSFFYAKYNFFNEANKIINDAIIEDPNDLYFQTMRLFVILKEENVYNFLNSWYELQSLKDTYLLYCFFEYPLLIDEIYSEIKQSNSLNMSLFLYIEKDYIRSKELFKEYIENNKIVNKTNFIDSQKENYSENLIVLLNEMYDKFISEN